MENNMSCHFIASWRDIGYLAHLTSSQHMVKYSWKSLEALWLLYWSVQEVSSAGFLAQSSVSLAIFANMLYSTFTKRQFWNLYDKTPIAVAILIDTFWVPVEWYMLACIKHVTSILTKLFQVLGLKNRSCSAQWNLMLWKCRIVQSGCNVYYSVSTVFMQKIVSPWIWSLTKPKLFWSCLLIHHKQTTQSPFICFVSYWTGKEMNPCSLLIEAFHP